MENKTIIQIIIRDNSGCSHVRHRYWANFMNSTQDRYHFMVTPFPLWDILNQTQTIVCQRFTTRDDLYIVKNLKAVQPKFGFKLIYEVDDQVFSIDGNGIPEWNPACFAFNTNMKKIEDVLTEELQYFDRIVVSTDYLKHAFEKRFINLPEIVTFSNKIPKYLWNIEKKKDIVEDIVKPVVLYSGAPIHTRAPFIVNGHDIALPGLVGDFEEWYNTVIKLVKEDKIDFVLLGGLHWYFEPIKEKIKVVEWTDCIHFPSLVQSIHADIQIAPLNEHVFNKCKSPLRLYESSVCGTPLLTNADFDYSPYIEAHPLSVGHDLEYMIDTICKKDNYNAVKNYQYNLLEKKHLYMEDCTSEYLEKIMAV